MSSEVNEVNVSADSVFICVKITYWVKVRRPRQATAPTYSKNAAPLDQPPLPRKNPRSAPVPTIDSKLSHGTKLFLGRLNKHDAYCISYIVLFKSIIQVLLITAFNTQFFMKT